MEDGTVLLRARLSGTGPPFSVPLKEGEVHMKTRHFYGIAFDHGSPAVGGSLVMPILSAIGVRVEEIMKRFARESFGSPFYF